MKNASANRKLEVIMKRHAERAAGNPSMAVSMGASTDTLLSVPNMGRLPVAENSNIYALQDSSGNFVFLAGYDD